jgi:hypothetical protein
MGEHRPSVFDQSARDRCPNPLSGSSYNGGAFNHGANSCLEQAAEAIQ